MTVSLHSDILQGIVIMTGNMGPLGIGFALQLEFLLHKQHPRPNSDPSLLTALSNPRTHSGFFSIAAGLCEVIRC